MAAIARLEFDNNRPAQRCRRLARLCLVLLALGSLVPLTTSAQSLFRSPDLGLESALSPAPPERVLIADPANPAPEPALLLPARASAAVAATASQTGGRSTPEAVPQASPANLSASPAHPEDEDFADPGESAAPIPVTGSLTDDYGAEFQLARQEAQGFLDHVGSWFKTIVEHARSWVGTPYRRGGESHRGIDCSGLTEAVFAAQGVELPRTAAEQFNLGQPVEVSELKQGDLVFFRNTYKHGISHVGIYVGDGMFIHAAGRRHGVIVSELARPYYQRRFAGARRVAEPPTQSVASLTVVPEPDAPGN